MAGISPFVSGPNEVAVQASATGPNSYAIVAKSGAGPGMYIVSETDEAIHAVTNSTTGAAIASYNTNAGSTTAAVYAEHKGKGPGVYAVSAEYEAIHADTQSSTTAAIAAYNSNPTGTGAAIFAKKTGGIGFAGFFDGDVHVTRNITCEGDIAVSGGDCAEEFEVARVEDAVPGAVMVADETGIIRACSSEYDPRVVGVVSGAGGYQPGVILHKQNGESRRPIAFIGKVECLVDASFGRISVGDLLTTSPTPGHAMRVDRTKSFRGAIVGKALSDLQDGRGLVRILAMLG